MTHLWADLAQLHFLRPWWLLALGLVPLLIWWASRQRNGDDVWRAVVDPHLLPHLLVPGREFRRRWVGWLTVVGLITLVLALAGPSWQRQPQPLWQTRQPLVIALDLSQAMHARDLPPDRLTQVRAKLAHLLRMRQEGEVALVVFAEDAYTVAPLTQDPANVAVFLDALSPEVMPVDGQRVDRAIAWSQRLLQQAGVGRGDILLLTDHAGPEAVAAAAQARAAGMRVLVLGVGTAQGGLYAAASGWRSARLQEGTLRALAASGGGRYHPLTVDDADLRALGVLEPGTGDGRMTARTALVWQDQGYWLLPLAMLCLLPAFRRGAGVWGWLLAAGLPLLASMPAQAQSAAAATGTWWRRADQVAYDRRQAGVEAYRRGDYARAAALFAGASDADGQYDLGNALAQLGRYDEAIAAYDRALRLDPGLADARYNRKLVEQQRQRQSPSAQAGHRAQAATSGMARSGAPGHPRQPASAFSPQMAAPTAPRTPTSPSPAAVQPADAQRQAQADAAQQARMQRALAQLRLEQPTTRTAQAVAMAPQETPAQRERRLANQAWLQRVPDDPGALLRARLLLEAQRRREGAER